MNSSVALGLLVCMRLMRESFCMSATITSAVFWLSFLSTSRSVTKNCGFVQNLAIFATFKF